MESVINEIEFDFDQRVSIRTDAKLSKEDVKQIISEAPEETLEEIVYQSLVTDELYLRARAKEIVAKLTGGGMETHGISNGLSTGMTRETRPEIKRSDEEISSTSPPPCCRHVLLVD